MNSIIKSFPVVALVYLVSCSEEFHTVDGISSEGIQNAVNQSDKKIGKRAHAENIGIESADAVVPVIGEQGKKESEDGEKSYSEDDDYENKLSEYMDLCDKNDSKALKVTGNGNILNLEEIQSYNLRVAGTGNKVYLSLMQDSEEYEGDDDDEDYDDDYEEAVIDYVCIKITGNDSIVDIASNITVNNLIVWGRGNKGNVSYNNIQGGYLKAAKVDLAGNNVTVDLKSVNSEYLKCEDIDYAVSGNEAEMYCN